MTVYLETQGDLGNIGVKTVDAEGRVTRRVITPGIWQNGAWAETDLTAESDDIKALAATLWTAGVKAAARALLEAQFADPGFPVLTPRQVRLALLSVNITEAMVDAALADNAAGMIEWKYANTFKRDHALIASLATGFGLTEGQVDTLWRGAVSL